LDQIEKFGIYSSENKGRSLFFGQNKLIPPANSFCLPAKPCVKNHRTVSWSTFFAGSYCSKNIFWNQWSCMPDPYSCFGRHDTHL